MQALRAELARTAPRPHLTQTTSQIPYRAPDPATDFPVAGGLYQNEKAALLGRNQNGDWLQVQLPETTAWIFAPSSDQPPHRRTPPHRPAPHPRTLNNPNSPSSDNPRTQPLTENITTPPSINSSLFTAIPNQLPSH